MLKEQAGVGGEEVGQDNTVKIWCVYDKVHGEVESYHPSYAWAWESLTRHKESRSVRMDAGIRELRATFSGEAHRVVTTAWDRYHSMLAMAAEEREAVVGQGLLKRAALVACRSHRRAKSELERLHAQRMPKKRMPAHELDVPDVVAISDLQHHLGPVLLRKTALEQAAWRNRQHLTDLADWDGQWCLVVELSDPLPCTSAASEFAGEVGVEGYVLRRAARLVHPTEAELAQIIGDTVLRSQ